jgi:nucleoside-diphosphate-sugar epimerase
VAEKTCASPNATTEDAPVSLYHDSTYSISKLIGELYANYFFTRHGLRVVKARFQNVYGPREILGAGRWRGTVHTVWRNVTPTFIWRAMEHQALPLDGGGRASRDFIFVDDIVRGLIACALKGRPGEVYNLASGVETSILELATIVNELTANPTSVDVRPGRDWDRSGRRFGSTEKAERELGFTRQVSLRDGLRATVDWTRENRENIRRCINQHEYFMARAE